MQQRVVLIIAWRAQVRGECSLTLRLHRGAVRGAGRAMLNEKDATRCVVAFFLGLGGGCGRRLWAASPGFFSWIFPGPRLLRAGFNPGFTISRLQRSRIIGLGSTRPSSGAFPQIPRPSSRKSSPLTKSQDFVVTSHLLWPNPTISPSEVISFGQIPGLRRHKSSPLAKSNDFAVRSRLLWPNPRTSSSEVVSFGQIPRLGS